MKFLGIASALPDGDTILINGVVTTVSAGNVVLYDSQEYVWTGSSWELLGDQNSYKIKQEAIASP